MEEILQHLGCQKLVNNGINCQPQLVSRISSINGIMYACLIIVGFVCQEIGLIFNLNFHFLRNEFIRLASSTTFDSPVAVFAVPTSETSQMPPVNRSYLWPIVRYSKVLPGSTKFFPG